MPLASSPTPCRVEEIGWIDLSRQRPADAPRVALPGETPWTRPSHGPVYVADTSVRWIGVEDGHLCLLRDSGHLRGPRLERLERLLVVGPATLDSTLMAALAGEHVGLLLCDAAGRAIFDWLPDEGPMQAELLAAQVRWSEDTSKCLAISCPLVAAKLSNYAALDEAYPAKSGVSIAGSLHDLARSAENAETLGALLGYEGAGAALWYKSFGDRLPSRFAFEGRVAPRAGDPVNVMLNVAQTHLYRSARTAARLVGLSPAIGFLHRPRAGFAPLAADLQEPFRMLMDRAVIEAAFQVRPEDFTPDENGPLPLRVSFAARRRLLALVYETLHTSVTSDGGSEPFTYQQHLVRLARSVRRTLLEGAQVNLNVLRLAARDGAGAGARVGSSASCKSDSVIGRSPGPAETSASTTPPSLPVDIDHGGGVQ